MILLESLAGAVAGISLPKLAGLALAGVGIAGSELAELGLKDVGDLGGKLAEAFGGQGPANPFSSFCGDVTKRIERVVMDRARSPRHRDPAVVMADLAQALTHFGAALPKMLIGPQELAAQDLDPTKIATFLRNRMAELDKTFLPFGQGSDNHEAHDLAFEIFRQACEAALSDGKAKDILAVPVARQTLQRLTRIENKLDTAASLDTARHAEMMAAIAREKGIEPKYLAVLFEKAEMDASIPAGREEEYIRAAVDALLAKGAEKLTPSNLGSEIDAALTEARKRMAKADAEGALAVLDKQLARETDERLDRQRGEALLWSEKADVLTISFRHEEAMQAFSEAVKLHPENPFYWFKLGDIFRTHGTLPEAFAAYNQAMVASRASGDERDLSVSHNKIGDVLRAQGDLPGALTSYKAGLGIATMLAGRDPGNMEWQRDLSVSHEKIGNVLRAQGDLQGALASFRDALAIATTLAGRDPGNMEWQRDLIVSYWKLADAGDRPSHHFGLALKIAEEMHRVGKLAPPDAYFVDALKKLRDEALAAGK